MTDVVGGGLRLGRAAALAWVRGVHRLRIEVEQQPPDEPVLFVANHGFGGVVDLQVFASLAAIDGLDRNRPLIMLTHHLAWTMRVGPLLEAVGARMASRDNAMAALTGGCDVLVFPGGDLEASKPWTRRHEVQFHGRSGFVDVARRAGAPIVPLVTRGAGSTVLVLSDGRRIARLLRADRLARTKAMPVNVALPYGLNIGVAGMLPYLPVPVPLATRVLPAQRCQEPSQECAQRIEAMMQAAMDDLGRRL